jgi:hypothetical protein
MPKEWVLKLWNFLFELQEFDARMLSGVGYTIVPRLSYGTNTELEHGHGMDVKLCMLQTSCIPTSLPIMA